MVPQNIPFFQKDFMLYCKNDYLFFFTQNEMLDQSSRLHLWTFKLQRNTKTTWKSLADEKPKLKPKLTKNMSNCAMNALSYVRWSTKQKHSWVARNKIVIFAFAMLTMQVPVHKVNACWDENLHHLCAHCTWSKPSYNLSLKIISNSFCLYIHKVL